jgi:uncharacterized membrane protein
MKIENKVHIAAPPGIVWSITIDLGRWPDWTPTVTALTRVDEGPFGQASVVRIKQPMQPESQWVVTEFVEGKRFTWESHRPGLKMKAAHIIDHHDAGTTNTLRAEVSGVLAILLWPMLKIALNKALADENRGLKARCEEVAMIMDR